MVHSGRAHSEKLYFLSMSFEAKVSNSLTYVRKKVYTFGQDLVTEYDDIINMLKL